MRPSFVAQGVCPLCNAQLPKKLVDRQAIVPDGHKEAEWQGPGEVVRRSHMHAATINGQREIVQVLKVWLGEFDAPWAPFCAVTCAARFGVDAWVNGYTGGSLERLPAPTAVDRRTLEQDFGRLVQHVSAPQEATLPFREAPLKLPPGTRLLRPGDAEWHPPGRPPPVPGVFQYTAKGRRIDMTPEAVAERAARAEHMRSNISYNRNNHAAAALTLRQSQGPVSVPPPTPEILRASNELSTKNSKLTEARALRFKQLWPDLRFPLATICYELNRMPGPRIAGASSMTSLATQLGLPSRRVETYSAQPVQGNDSHPSH